VLPCWPIAPPKNSGIDIAVNASDLGPVETVSRHQSQRISV
jgi:hypothetical protein